MISAVERGPRRATSAAAFGLLLAYLAIDFARPHDMFAALRAYRPMLVLGSAVLALAVWQRRRHLLSGAGDFAPFLVLLAIAALETIVSIDRGASALALVAIAKMTALVWLIAVLVSTERRFELVCWVLCASLGVLAVWSIADGMRRGLLDEFTVANVVHGPGESTGGAFQDNNDLARVIALSVPLWWMLAARRGGLWKRAIAAGGSIVAVAGVELTFSRSGFLAMAAGGAVVCLLHYRPAWRGLAVYAVCVAALLVVSPRTYLARIGAVLHPLQDSSVRSRLSIWEQAGERARRDLLVGRGPGTFESAQVDRPPEKRRSSHNVLIEVLTDMGVGGLAAFLWVLLAAFRRLVILRRAAERASAVDLATAALGVGAALVAYFTASMALSAPFQSPPFVLIGLSIALARIAGGHGIRA